MKNKNSPQHLKKKIFKKTTLLKKNLKTKTKLPSHQKMQKYNDFNSLTFWYKITLDRLINC